jgi:hypothetical protein
MPHDDGVPNRRRHKRRDGGYLEAVGQIKLFYFDALARFTSYSLSRLTHRMRTATDARLPESNTTHKVRHQSQRKPNKVAIVVCRTLDKPAALQTGWSTGNQAGFAQIKTTAGQPYFKAGAFPGRRIHMNASTVLSNDVVGDKQAKAGPLRTL